MIIASSNVALASQHTLAEQESSQESLKFWRDGKPVQERMGNQSSQQGGALLIQFKKDQLSISAQAQSLFSAQTQAQGTQSATAADPSSGYALSDADRQKILLIEKMIEMLTGKKIKLRVLDPSALRQKQIPVNLQSGRNSAAQSTQAPVAKHVGWGMAYDLHQVHTEQETTTMQAAGAVRTADGREINFAMNVSMSRQFMSRLDVSVRAGDQPVDPLILNLSGAPGTLTDKKYSFDIDSDGTAEQISFAAPGSGFLALDRNGDGKINDGGELFGPASGNGFSDLAALDGDGNQWIDENDQIFSQLRIWMKDEAGKDQLVALGQAGVGAIYLGNLDTEFAVKDETNAQQGQVRRSGMFLRENGSAGAVQQIDLAI